MPASDISVRVPYLDLRAQYESIKPELLAAIGDVFDSSSYVLGPAVERFEREFAAFCGNAHCVAVSNGTVALHLALVALGIGPGDEVITQANTFIATVAAILHAGATPVLVDVVRPTYAIDVAAVERAIGPRTKAILPVHLFGQPCDLSAIGALAGRRGLALIEDASQAHGATFHGAPIGSGDVATFSFYPGKNLGAAGEAGGIVVRDEALARRLRLLRNHGSEQKYIHTAVGYNYRLEGLQGAVLGVKLRHLAAWTAARQRIAVRYDAEFAAIERPAPLPETTSARHIYAVLVDDRDGVAERLKKCGVDTNVHYPIPCHLQPGYAHLGYHAGDFPNTEWLARRELSLPIYPEMTALQIDHVVASVLAETS
jgi:dTDP-4-amino-4,6-dideoxygalactose transaminase